MHLSTLLKSVLYKAPRAMLVGSLLGLISLSALAQHKAIDVIILNNGTQHKGRIVESNLPNTTTIFIDETQIVAVPNDSIQSTLFAKRKPQFKTRGYTAMYEWNLALGRKRVPTWGWGNPAPIYETVGGFGFQMFHGYRFNPFIAVGATAAMELNNDGVIAPVSLGLRGSTKHPGLSPMYSLDLGYTNQLGYFTGVPRAERLRGFHASPAVGFEVNTGNGTALTFLLGYTYRQLKAKSDNEWASKQIDMKQHRVNFRTGFTF